MSLRSGRRQPCLLFENQPVNSGVPFVREVGFGRGSVPGTTIYFHDKAGIGGTVSHRKEMAHGQWVQFATGTIPANGDAMEYLVLDGSVDSYQMVVTAAGNGMVLTVSVCEPEEAK